MLSNVKSMTRTFYPVGQGAFYRERFTFNNNNDVFNIVYDCGTETPKGKTNIDDIINNWEDGPIDILFISHFHEDHISKIVELIDKIHVKLLIAPYLSAIDKEYIKLETLSRNAYKNNDEINYEEIESLFSIIDNYEKYFIEKVEEVEYIAKEIFQNKNIKIISEGELKNVLDNEKFSDSWILDAFVSDIPNKRKIVEKFNQEFKQIDINSIDNIIKILNCSEEKRKLKKIYGTSIHKLCLLLYSGPTNDNVFQQNFKYCRIKNCIKRIDIICSNTKPAGCLYTGDYYANNEDSFDKLRIHFEKYISKIGCLQIPHHGSDKNFNDEFLLLDCFFVVCAGRDNRHSHPGLHTISSLKYNKKPLYKITENNRKVEFIININ